MLLSLICALLNIHDQKLAVGLLVKWFDLADQSKGAGAILVDLKG